jgi:hypothetical protein
MAARRLHLLLAAPAAAIAAGFLFVAWVPTLPHQDTSIASRIGHEMARETLRLRTGSGRVIVLARDTSEFPQPAVEAALNTFQADLASASVRPETVRRFAIDPLRQVQVPPGDFAEYLRRGKSGDVIVSFLGPPLLGEDQLSRLGTIQPRVVAFCPGYLPRYLNLKLLGDRNLLHGGVVARVDAAGENFEGQYQTLAAAFAAPQP